MVWSYGEQEASMSRGLGSELTRWNLKQTSGFQCLFQTRGTGGESLGVPNQRSQGRLDPFRTMGHMPVYCLFVYQPLLAGFPLCLPSPRLQKTYPHTSQEPLPPSFIWTFLGSLDQPSSVSRGQGQGIPKPHIMRSNLGSTFLQAWLYVCSQGHDAGVSP